MTILRVFDTVIEARKEAEYAYWICKDKGFNIKYHAVHPYKINFNNDCYVYAANNPRYLRGMRANKIEDYTKSGICDEIRVCEYPL